MPEQFDELLHRVYEIRDPNAAASILSWDQSTYMPPGGGQARAEQPATPQRLAHERLVADEMGRLPEDLEPCEKGRAVPEIPAQTGAGEFAPPAVGPAMRHLRAKYGELYAP